MTLDDYLRVLRERWITILTAVVIALVAAGGIWFLRPQEYTATLTLYVSAQTADSTSTAYQGAQLSEQRVKSYVELVDSPRVSQEVVRKLGLPELPEDLAERITATSSLESVLIDVAVTDRSPQQAATIAECRRPERHRLWSTSSSGRWSPAALPPVAVRMVQPAACRPSRRRSACR